LKYHIGFFSILLVVLGGFGYLAATFNEQHLFYLHGANDDVNEVLNSFRQSHHPIIELNFSELYGGSGQFQILHPMLDIKTTRLNEMAPTCRGVDLNHQKNGLGAGALCRFDRQVRNDQSGTSSEENLSSEFRSKREALERFLAEREKLPDNFLTSPPFVDAAGHSYAFLLSQRGVPPFGGRTWVEQHLSYFKISELKSILKKYNIDNPQFSLISRLSESEIEEAIRGAPLVLTQDYLLLKNQSRYGFSPLSYWAYDIQQLNVQLADGKYELLPFVSDAVCLQKLGNACWTYSSKHALSYLYRYSLVLLGVVAFAFLIFSWIYIKYLIEKNREQKKNRLSLQVLSHEFRTPVASMLLIIDQLVKASSRLDPSDQDLITRMSQEAYRLQRIIEVSKTYLQAESRRIPFKNVEIPSINNWICDFIAEFDQNIKCDLLEVDQKIEADPFWLKFVLSSLVQNAFAHGQQPVSIRLARDRKELQITVEDQGQCEFRSLKQMSNAFVKSSQSRGMGLGLNIVRLIVEEWGSEIRFSKFPTAFTLSLIDNKAQT